MRKINKKEIIILIIIISVIGVYYFFIKENDYLENNQIDNVLNTNEEKNDNVENKVSDTENLEKIIVYMSGAVKNEGLYEMNENSRIADGIEKAGGLTEDANINNLNLAFVLEDGMKVYIPRKCENNQVKDETSTYVSKEKGNEDNLKDKNTGSKGDKININTATQAELETLPGIGPSTATKIINYRKENGKFNNIEDIKKVSGIGDSKYSQIKDLIKT